MAKSRSSSGLIILIILVAAAATGGYFYWRQSSEKPPEYSTTTIGMGDITQVVTATGGLQAVTSVDVSSQISGLINEIDVDFNSPVKKGQVLARLDPATYESRLSSAQAQFANTKANHSLVRLNTERSRALFEKKLISQQELDQAEAQLQQAEAQMLIQNAAVETAKVDLSRCTIYSPIDGIVIDRVADVGKTVAASLNAPTLFTIANDLSKMQISAAVAEADVGSIETGQQVNFTVDAYPTRQFRGRVSQIRNAPRTLSNVVTYETIIDVSNADLKLKPGMTANVSIVISQRLGALRIANSALRVRLPEGLLPPPPPKAPEKTDGKATTDNKDAAPAAKTMTDDERRKALREIMTEAGFTRGGGPPSPEVIARAQQLAKDRGIELPENFGRGRGGNGAGTDRAGGNAAPITRTVYKLVGTDPKTYHPEPASVKLGVSDGITTEVLDGLKEGDVVITAVSIPGVAASPTAQPASPNPFSGGRNFGGGGRGGR
jgi:HlyD family secretion protein